MLRKKFGSLFPFIVAGLLAFSAHAFNLGGGGARVRNPVRPSHDALGDAEGRLVDRLIDWLFS